MHTQRIDPDHIRTAADLLLQKELVAFPTETVYGLGAVCFWEDAVKKIFTVKGRPSDNPLIVHVADLGSVEQVAQDIPSLFYEIAEVFFPGPLTVILPKKAEVSPIVSGGLDTVAVRMPRHPIALKLLNEVKLPLVAPSANLSGRPSSTDPFHVLEDFDGKISGVILGGSSEIGIESTVVRIVQGGIEILRPGAILQEQIEDVLQQKVKVHSANGSLEAPASPGMKYRHYAPKASVKLFRSEEEAYLYCDTNTDVKRMILANGFQGKDTFPLTPSSFYFFLRKADETKCDEVVIVCDPQTLSHEGFMNRIEKASAG